MGSPACSLVGCSVLSMLRVAGLCSLLMGSSLLGWRGWSGRLASPRGDQSAGLIKRWADTWLALKTQGPGAPPPPWRRPSGSQSSRTISPSVTSFPFPKCYLPNENMGFPGGSARKESTCNAGDPGSIPGLGRSPGEGKGYPT